MRKIYHGDIHADPVNEIRGPAYSYQRACFYTWLGLSGELTLDWVMDQICLHHNGRLYDTRGRLVELDEYEPESQFAIDARRSINRFKEKAKQMPRQALPRKLVERIMWLDFALVIYLGRIE